jgi:hypothetical protein
MSDDVDRPGDDSLEAQLQDAILDAEQSAAVSRFLARAVLSGSADARAIAREMLEQDELRIGWDPHAPGGPNVGRGWPARLIAMGFMEAMSKGRGELWNNTVFHMKSAKGDHLVVRVQNVNGETPEEQRAKAQTRAEALAAALATLVEECEEAVDEAPWLRPMLDRAKAALLGPRAEAAARDRAVVDAAAKAVAEPELWEGAARFERDMNAHFAQKKCGG